MLGAKRNPLAFPAGNEPKFNHRHRALAGVSPGHGFTAIAAGGQYVDLLRRARTGNDTDIPMSMNSVIGWCQKDAPTHSLRWFDSGISIANDQQYTAAAIVHHITPAGSGAFLYVGWDTSHTEFRVQSDNTVQIRGTTGSTTSTITMANDTPYFIAVSATTAITNLLLLNLRTGAVTTEQQSASLTFSAADLAIIIPFSDQSGLRAYPGYAAALAYNPASYLSLGELRQWAEDPWSCWYPDVRTQITGISGVFLRQRHYRFRTDSGAVDATPTWGSQEDSMLG